ncbi:MAG: nitroreductase family protein, partial [Burkholderiales bacterium]
LVEGNRIWAKNAPMLMLSLADTVFRSNEKPNRWAQHDTGAASENMFLQSVALGLMLHQMGGFDATAIQKAFAIPERYTPMAMIAVGYQAVPEILDETLRQKELAPRTRQPLEECFFEGSWGKTVHS